MPAIRESFFNADQKIWSGRKVVPLFHKDMSLGQVALFVLGVNPQKVIQISDPTNERLTCEDMATLGTKIAQHCQQTLGLQQEDVIGLMASKTTFVAPVLLASFTIGTIINSIYHTSDKNTIKYSFSLTRPKVIFCDADGYETLTEAMKEISLNSKVYILKGHIDGVLNLQDIVRETTARENFSPVELLKGGNQTAAIMFSSGTTGSPKGVCVSHRQFLSRQDLAFIGSNDVLFTFSTFYWITGVLVFVRSLITGGLRIITDEVFTPELFLNLIEKYKITQAVVSSSHTSLSIQSPDIARRDLSSIRNFLTGGSAVPTAISKKMQEYIPTNSFIEGYGLTELGGVSNMNIWPERKEGSVGRLTPNTEASIFGENGEALGINETGAICLRSLYKWEGYFRNPEMTAETICKDSWIRTGDLGYFDEDGYLFVCGRQKDTLKYHGFQISPNEIDEEILKIPGVIEACVFGIPDKVAGDLLAAAIVKDPKSLLTKKDVCEAVAGYFTKEKHLHGGVFFVNEMPKNSSGKILRQKLVSIVGDTRM